MNAPHQHQTKKQALAAERKRRERVRKKQNIDLVEVPLPDKFGVTDRLIDSGYLPLANSDDDGALGAAIAKFLSDPKNWRHA